MVVAAPRLHLLDRPLKVRRAAELAAPDDERVVEQAEALQVADQRGTRGVGVLALNLELRVQVAVLVPAGVEELHETRAALDEAAGHEAVVREAPLPPHVRAVHLQHLRRLLAEVSEFRHARLHPVGHLVLGDARGDLRVAELAQAELVHAGQVVEDRPPALAAHAVGVRQVQHRVAAAAELDALEARRQEPAAPVEVVEDLPAARLLVAAGHDDEAGEVVGLGAQAVGEPAPHARAAGHLVAGHEERDRRRVVHLRRVHRLDEAQVVGDGGGVVHEVGPPRATLPVPGEPRDFREARPRRLPAGHGAEPRPADDRVGDLFALAAGEFGLVVEEIDVRRGAVLEQVDDALGLRGEVRQVGEPADALPRGGGAAHQRRERGRADADRGPAEEVPAVQMEGAVGDGVHGRAQGAGLSEPEVTDSSAFHPG